MATIINTPGQPSDTGNSASIWVLGLIVLALIGLFAFFVWPGFNNQAAAPAPAPTGTTNRPDNVYNTTINSTSTTNNGAVNATTTVNPL